MYIVPVRKLASPWEIRTRRENTLKLNSEEKIQIAGNWPRKGAKDTASTFEIRTVHSVALFQKQAYDMHRTHKKCVQNFGMKRHSYGYA